MSSIPHANVCAESKRAITMFLKTASIQLLYHHIQRVYYSARGNPYIEFVNCYPVYERSTWSNDPLRDGIICQKRMMDAFLLEHHHSICYDFGIHIKLAGYIIVADGQQPLLTGTTITKLPVQGHNTTLRDWKKLDRAVPGVGSVVISRAPMTREEWREEWLANESGRWTPRL
jgi:hypothetical protein